MGALILDVLAGIGIATVLLAGLLTLGWHLYGGDE